MSNSKSYPSIGQSFGITGIVVIAMFLLAPIYSILKETIGQDAGMLVYYLLSIGGAFFLVNIIRHNKLGRSKYNMQIDNPRIVPFIVIGSIALLFGVVSPIGSLIPMSDSIKKMFLEFAGQKGVLAFLMMVIAAPVFEELIFRGIILDGLLKRYSPVTAILVSSFLFGAVHLNPWQFVTGFVIGIFAGWVYQHTRSLLAAMIIHASVNCAGYIARLNMNAHEMMEDDLVEMYGSAEKLMLVLLIAILIAVVCIDFLRKEFRVDEARVNNNSNNKLEE